MITEEDKSNYENGEKQKEKKMKELSLSLKKVPPSMEELQMIHNIFIERKANENKSIQNNTSQINNNEQVKTVLMSQTKRENIFITHPQETNINKTIFGGYLIRVAFELAFNTCVLFSRRFPFFCYLEDVTFQKPVLVGHLLSLKSQLIYSDTQFMEVKVICSTQNPLEDLSVESITNTLFFTFRVDPNEGPLKVQVLPDTYDEAMNWIEGMRKIKNINK